MKCIFLGLLDFYILFCNVDGIIGDNKSYLVDIKAIIVDVDMGIYGGMSVVFGFFYSAVSRHPLPLPKAEVVWPK